jgi:hypothetical protein
MSTWVCQGRLPPGLIIVFVVAFSFGYRMMVMLWFSESNVWMLASLAWVVADDCRLGTGVFGVYARS